MNVTSTTLKRLRWHLLILAACLTAAAVIAYSMTQYGKTQSLRTTQAAQNATQMQQRAQRLRIEEQDIRDKIARYKSLEEHGIIGVERRLDWVELLRSIQNERKLIDIDYELSPQMLLAPNLLPKPASGHDFYSSRMRLRIPLLHEDDLTGTLRDLSQRASALIRVRECELKRHTAMPLDSETRQGFTPQIDAECLIDWITVRGKGEAGASKQ